MNFSQQNLRNGKREEKGIRDGKRDLSRVTRGVTGIGEVQVVGGGKEGSRGKCSSPAESSKGGPPRRSCSCGGR